MSDIRFDFEWVDPGDAKGAELRATWARLSIAVGDQSVTQLTRSRIEERSPERLPAALPFGRVVGVPLVVPTP